MFFAVDGGAAELGEDLRPHGLVGREVEFLFGVVTEIQRRGDAGLQPVGADDLALDFILDQQMLAEEIELIGVEAGFV